ncbi:DUF4194 domain-containing protein [Cryobacterium sp. TMT1-2-2]|uniref:DUF4194 domain-containing protein n=1 Tax=Cryobacterium sp. TMT1-2-2 TaxID=1259233 RepID=UPI00106DB4BE|nr:DUF4194 domain-containing protein [Cryobacterium sp. TMT1-2-2]TFD12878.1 DUF4194 domain-containing protein [Cryobacterium sp. TMT1-2-2]
MSPIEQIRDNVAQPDWADAPVTGVEDRVGDRVEDTAEYPSYDDGSASAGDEDVEPPSTHALFDGDEGGLELDERRVLVLLLKNRFITSESHPREWKTLVASRQVIARQLNNLFLELKFDSKREVAYKRPVTSDTGGRDFPTLVHDTIWQREETALLVFLRVRARNDEVRGEVQSRVSQAEMLEYLRENRPESATNQVSDDRRADRATTALKSAGLLVRTSEDGVFRISPAIEPMLPMPTLNNLLTWLNVRTKDVSTEHVSTESGGPTDDEAVGEELS